MISFIRDALRVLNMPCRGHTELLSRALDGPLSRGESFGMRVHLLYCRGCIRFRRQITLLREIAASLGREAGAEPGLPADVSERVIKRAADEARKI